MNKSKKLLVLSEYWVPDEGGMAVYARQLLPRLGKLGWEIRILCPKTISQRIETNHKNISFRFFTSPSIHAIGRLSIFPVLMQEFSRQKFDAVLDFSVSPYSGATALFIPFLKIPHLIIAHGNEVSRLFPEVQLSQLFKRFCLFGYKSASRIVPNSHFTASLFVKLSIPKEKLKVIYCGVDTEVFYPKFDNRFNKSDNQVRNLLIVGQIKETKGHKPLLMALPQIISAIPTIKLHIIGNGPLEIEMRQLVTKLKLNEYVHFHGQIPFSDLPYHYQTADLTILPTQKDVIHFEGFGLAAAEALSCGCPVAASNIGGHTEFVIDGFTGRHFDSSIPTDIADKIIDCLLNPESLDKYSRNGIKLIHNQFSWDKSVSEWNNLLEEVIEENHSQKSKYP